MSAVEQALSPMPLPEARIPPPDSLRARCALLSEEHRDLDDLISALSRNTVSDDALLSRLKKRKLHLKDEIARIEAWFRLMPLPDRQSRYWSAGGRDASVAGDR